MSDNKIIYKISELDIFKDLEGKDLINAVRDNERYTLYVRSWDYCKIQGIIDLYTCQNPRLREYVKKINNKGIEYYRTGNEIIREQTKCKLNKEYQDGKNFKCLCGSNISAYSWRKHNESKKHILFMNNI
jgi:hypothetical protein